MQEEGSCSEKSLWKFQMQLKEDFLWKPWGRLSVVCLKGTLVIPGIKWATQWRWGHRAKPRVFEGPWTTLSPAEHWPLGYINSTKIWRLPQCLQQPRVGRGLKWAKTAFTSPSHVSRSPVLFGRWHRLSPLTATKIHIEYSLNLITCIFWEKKEWK